MAVRLVDRSDLSDPAREVAQSGATLSANTTLSANATRPAVALSQAWPPLIMSR